MATKRQIQANRANARKSTGPRTAMVGCPFLGAAAFRGGIPVFKPQPVFQPVPQAMWQLRRVPAYETGYLNLLAGDVDNLAPDRYDLSGHSERLAALYMDDAKRDHPRLESLARHRVRHERSYYKALHELERLQQGRAGHPVPPPKVVEIHGEMPAGNPPAPAPPPVAPSPRLPLSQSSSQPTQNKTDNPKLAWNRKTAVIKGNRPATTQENRGGSAESGRVGPVGKPVEV